MELKIAVEELARALRRTQGIIERKTPMAVLTNVLLEARSGDGVRVTAFDNEIGLVGQHPCEVTAGGAVAVSGRHMYDIVSHLPGGTVSLRHAAGTQLDIACGSSRFKIMTTPAEDYPALPRPEGAVGLELPPDVMLRMIERTHFAISTDETRYNLGGVFLERTREDSIRMVATDGHRLCLVDQPVKEGARLERGVLIPKKGLMELRRLLGEDGGVCKLGFTKGSAIVTRDGVTMVMRLVDGEFPDYRQVIPKESGKSVIVDRQAFTDTLKRVAVVASDKTFGVRLTLAGDKVVISSQNPDLGDAQDELPAKISGGDLEIGFNARYLIDAVSVLSCDEVRIEVADQLSPGVIRAVGDDSYLAVVMPMRL